MSTHAQQTSGVVVVEYQVGLEVITPQDFDVLSQAFYDNFDGVISRHGGRTTLLAYVEAAHPIAAAHSFIETAEDLLDVSVCRLDLDLVDASEIANRLEVSRQSVHLWATGGRKSLLPVPLGVPGGRRIWAWADIVEWAHKNGHGADEAPGLNADHAAQINAYLAKRRDRVTSGARINWSVSPGSSKVDYAVESQERVSPVPAGRP